MELRDRVAKALQKIGKSNEELAQILSVNRNTIASYKKCKGDIKGVLLVGLSEKFGYNPDWLLTGQGEMFLRKDDHSIRQKGKGNIGGINNGVFINGGNSSVVQTGGREAEGRNGPETGLTEPKKRAMQLFNKVIVSNDADIITLMLGNLEALAGLLGKKEGRG